MKKTIRKAICLALALTLLCALVGCGGGKSSEAGQSGTNPFDLNLDPENTTKPTDAGAASIPAPTDSVGGDIINANATLPTDERQEIEGRSAVLIDDDDLYFEITGQGGHLFLCEDPNHR